MNRSTADGNAVPTGRSHAPNPPTLPECTFIRHLGSGASADVYLYHDHAHHRMVAAKVTRTPLSGDDQEHFRGEVRALSRLGRHPNILAVYGSLVFGDGRGCILLEHAPHGSCQDLLRRHPLPERRVIDMGILLANALHAAHRQGIVHRDMKPSNVLFDCHGAPMLADFGVCAHLYRPSTLTGHSPLWSAPEVLAGLTGGTDLSDVYSLGATLFAMLTGSSPRTYPRAEQRTADNRVGTVVPSFDSMDVDVSPAMERVLRTALNPHPDERYGSMSEFAHALSQVRSAGDGASFHQAMLPFSAMRWQGSRPARHRIRQRTRLVGVVHAEWHPASLSCNELRILLMLLVVIAAVVVMIGHGPSSVPNGNVADTDIAGNVINDGDDVSPEHNADMPMPDAALLSGRSSYGRSLP